MRIEDAYRVLAATYGADNAKTAVIESSLAQALRRAGKLDEARNHEEHALATLRAGR